MSTQIHQSERSLVPKSRPHAPPAAGIRPARSERTRLELLLAAEKLFALHGLRGVSLRQVVAATQQRNISTVHYHFGSREALVYAICDFRMPAIEEARAARIARFNESPPARAQTLSCQYRSSCMQEKIWWPRPCAARIIATLVSL